MTTNDNLPDVNSQIPVESLHYEDAFKELEQIVQVLEENEYSLEAAMQLFERGQVLARRCALLLDQAEVKVQHIIGEALVDFES